MKVIPGKSSGHKACVTHWPQGLMLHAINIVRKLFNFYVKAIVVDAGCFLMKFRMSRSKTPEISLFRFHRRFENIFQCFFEFRFPVLERSLQVKVFFPLIRPMSIYEFISSSNVNSDIILNYFNQLFMS